MKVGKMLNHKQPMEDSELQKAIDDITKTTSVDPTFSDPVAAPSMLPDEAEFDTIEPVGPFPAPEPIMPSADFGLPEVPAAPEAPVMPEMPVMAETPIAPVVPEEAPIAPATEIQSSETKMKDIKQVKDSALRDLLPLLDKMPIDPSRKFSICKDAFEALRDYAILEYAYKAAKKISDDNERGEALLYIVNVINKIS